MRRCGSGGVTEFLLISLSFAAGIVASVILPDIILIILLTSILVFLCMVFLK